MTDCKHEQVELLASERIAYDVTDGKIDWDSGMFIYGGIDPVFTCLECSEDLHPITVDGVESTPQVGD